MGTPTAKGRMARRLSDYAHHHTIYGAIKRSDIIKTAGATKAI
jgi:hypothetical protein